MGRDSWRRHLAQQCTCSLAAESRSQPSQHPEGKSALVRPSEGGGLTSGALQSEETPVLCPSALWCLAVAG